MKHFLSFCLIAVIGTFFTGCLSDTYEVMLPDSKDIITVPADGGAYSFTVVAGPRTKTSFEDRLWSFEYRISVDGNIIDQRIANISIPNERIHEGDAFNVDFTVPANETAAQRSIMVEALKAENGNRYHYHVDADDKGWKLVWQGVQLGH